MFLIELINPQKATFSSDISDMAVWPAGYFLISLRRVFSRIFAENQSGSFSDTRIVREAEGKRGHAGGTG